MGGYFIINGNEKIIRMLLLPRRNFVRMPCSECVCLGACLQASASVAAALSLIGID